MAKFGELIDLDVPVLINFYKKEKGATSLESVLNTVADKTGGKLKIIKVDIDENQQLSEALKISKLPTLMLYKDKEMVWRHSGSKDAAELMAVIENYV